ncbi:hypothetical protein PF004_g23174 [Phytophthora fragariae]|uniref:Uncharacterized protein n=1 Tax=Phytophthora fragariae TaxID=53985 RepID=A0A6A3DS68_9STRA|nr:hypothetical protein PF009_g25890 [Phytophthora fragariae]KAE9186127.1 hypothetical protein PF004_g23174 [Phytophthora fragariae]
MPWQDILRVARGRILDCLCLEQPLMVLNDGVESSSAVEPLQMLQHSGRATRVDAVLCFQVHQYSILGALPQLKHSIAIAGVRWIQSEAIGEEQRHEGDEDLGLRPLLLRRPYLPTGLLCVPGDTGLPFIFASSLSIRASCRLEFSIKCSMTAAWWSMAFCS